MTQLINDNDHITASELTTIILVGTLSVATLLVLPILVTGAINGLGLLPEQAGVVVSIDLAGLAMSNFLALFWINRLPWKPMMYAALAALVVGNIATYFQTDFAGLATVRFFTNLGGGCILAILLARLGRAANSDRNFALFTTSELIFGVVGLFVLPSIAVKYGPQSVYFVFAALALLLVPAVYKTIPRRTSESKEDLASGKIHWPISLLILLAIVIFFLAQTALWAFLDQIGLAANIQPGDMVSALVMISIGGLLGALTAVFIGVRLGRLWPVVIASLAQVTALVLLMNGATFWSFVIQAGIFNYAWNLIIPYQLGLLADADQSGKAMVLSGTATGIGVAGGPMIAAGLLNGYGFNGINIFSAAACLLSLAVLVAALLWLREYRKA